MLNFFLLGRLEAHSPFGRFAVRGGIQGTLLQVLLASEGRIVPAESLVGELWGESPPDGVANALHAHISRLRKKIGALEPHRTSSRLVGNPFGYQLLVAEGELDATVFVSEVRRAQESLPRDPRRASEVLRAALLMWRGPVFGGDVHGVLCQAAAVRYEEYRIHALELFFESELALGNHTHILGELREAHAANPLRERFCEQLMLALYRSGRQAEALATYRQMWSRLANDLGIEPSPVLRRTELAILGHDPDLDYRESRAADLSYAI
ncbi:AfsR/SARP family transcriptional regulator [Streptomyces litchfieldiae]|uniref:AfsR/SARP family transcriptional regulator n=1 Tax=Streptomyces litchfieldiae TaxID=3075543 RepID=A0ABU2MZC3_9ACTN|nr:AfsR/SARP family transcriptional regulator [Streptomyces sp. DSM 44938]MDT0346409.1 AfsR/SARP family transcriptional regulator [Streptomyces sp. DSM 44938]